MRNLCLLLCLAFVIANGVRLTFAYSTDHILTIDTTGRGPEISPTLYGIFFEDINHAVEGGLYAELVRNGSFEHSDPWEAWASEVGAEADVKLMSDMPLNRNNLHYLRIQITETGGLVRLINSGYGGIPIEKNQSYNFSLYARADVPFAGVIRVALEASSGEVCAQGEIEGLGSEWEKYERKLTAVSSCSNARLVLTFDSPGTIYIDMVSLFPAETFHGMRMDLVQMLEDLNPGFMRFPGGCFVNGDSLKNAFRWKDSIGPREVRPTRRNFWGYAHSYGIGLYEYLLLAEYLGAEPLPILNPGMSWQGFQPVEICPLDKMDEWIDDALDLIEFANGPVTSEWGAVRASLGHPEPFDLKYLGIGNENWGRDYFERFELFQQAIKARYPEIKLVFATGTTYSGVWFDMAWQWAKDHGVDVVDEHIYASPAWFLLNTERYDLYDREGPKVMVGEFAAHTGDRRNTLEAALAEAAFMTGLERNSDVVVMASYAPLFNRVGWSQWVPDLIWFDGTRAYGTPSYYVQMMFATNRGDVVLPSSLSNEKYVFLHYKYKHLYHVVSYDSESKDIIIKVVNPWPDTKTCQIVFDGDPPLTGYGQAIVLTSDDPRSENTFENPLRVAPRELQICDITNPFTYTFEGYSVTILRIGTQGL